MYVSGESHRIFACKISRRQLLKLGIITSFLSMNPFSSYSSMRNAIPQEKALSFYNIHTGERLSTVYWSQGEYIKESLYDINYIMRDYRANETKQIDIRLLDLLHDMHVDLHAQQVFHIISGYRTLKTNNMLLKSGHDVSKNSLHILGKAIDIRVPSKNLSELMQVAVHQRGGGVGYYPRSDFVHVDVGLIRYWE